MAKGRDFEDILDQHNLKKTSPRLRVLSQISSKKTATSQPDLENAISGVDRVTLYRVLSVFQEKGIIHKVFDLNGTAKYAMCSVGCNESHHHDEHIHFNCVKCNNVYCLNEQTLPAVSLPKGFSAEEFTFYASGTCPNCKSEN